MCEFASVCVCLIACIVEWKSILCTHIWLTSVNSFHWILCALHFTSILVCSVWFGSIRYSVLCFHCANMIFRLLLWRACWMLNTFCNEKQIHITFNAIVRHIFGFRSVAFYFTEFMHVHFTSFMSKNSHARVQTKCHTCRNERSHDKSPKLCSFLAKPPNTFEVFI